MTRRHGKQSMPEHGGRCRLAQSTPRRMRHYAQHPPTLTGCLVEHEVDLDSDLSKVALRTLVDSGEKARTNPQGVTLAQLAEC